MIYIAYHLNLILLYLYLLILRMQSGKAVSSCPCAYDFMLSPASKISKQKAYTNMPIECLICQEIHWKYNIQHHLQERHPSWESNVAPGNNLSKFGERITITNEEEERLHIPESYQGESVVAQDVYNAGRVQHLPSIHDSRDDSPPRLHHSHFENISPAPF
ncbi:hypothetical protein BDQ12DRAFT_64206 [Crucibulum laeve]|uniref:C2H2-type domain-containing protein n=1 Tax=Crucibulum laeve TaxID=68775 RepID=A0A5C3LH35_9AGAR|nr:hypothetical protein BDQ12DRAFT_64206 [Crucibulum laeve]